MDPKLKYIRRDFLKKTILASGCVLTSGFANPAIYKISSENNHDRISNLKKPLAIAMWDYSWILRHHRYGEFEDWNAVLGGLAERGYNAIRIDAMPQFVAADTDGQISDVVEIDADRSIMVKVSEYHPAARHSLEDVRDRFTP